MSRLLSALLAALVMALSPACTTTGTRQPVDQATAVANAAAVAAPLLEGGTRIAVSMVLVKNPQLVDDFEAVSVAAAAILAAADPSVEGFAATLRNVFPELTAPQATQIATALASAYRSGAALYHAQTGRTLVLTELITDPAYKAAADSLAGSLVRGVTSGLADYRAAADSVPKP